jgi:hypothetical protein
MLQWALCMLRCIQVSQEVLDASVVNIAASAAAETHTHHQVELQQQQEGFEAEAHASVQPAQPSLQQEQQQVLAAVNGHGQQQQEMNEVVPAAITAEKAHASQQPAQTLQLEQQQQASFSAEASQQLTSSNVQTQHCAQLQAKSSAERVHDNLCCCCSEPGGGAGLGSGGPEVVARKGERVSLTMRRVLKVHKALGVLRR